MPIRRRVAKRRFSELTFPELLELRIGPGHTSAFESDKDRRAAWEFHRDDILADASPAHVPWAAVEYDGATPLYEEWEYIDDEEEGDGEHRPASARVGRNGTRP